MLASTKLLPLFKDGLPRSLSLLCFANLIISRPMISDLLVRRLVNNEPYH